MVGTLDKCRMTKKEIATIDSNSNNNSKRTTTKGQMKIALTGTKY